MKKLLVFSAILVVASCNNGTETKSTSEDASKSNTEVTYAYPINYSSKFEMGDPKKSQKVSELWKAFDDNKLMDTKNDFADSVSMEFSGMVMSGNRDTILANMSGYRSSLASVVSKIDVIFSTRSIDKDSDGNWICVWGSEKTTSMDNKVDSAKIHEIWHFNKEGKIDQMSQYKQEYPMAK